MGYDAEYDGVIGCGDHATSWRIFRTHGDRDWGSDGVVLKLAESFGGCVQDRSATAFLTLDDARRMRQALIEAAPILASDPNQLTGDELMPFLRDIAGNLRATVSSMLASLERSERTPEEKLDIIQLVFREVLESTKKIVDRIDNVQEANK